MGRVVTLFGLLVLAICFSAPACSPNQEEKPLQGAVLILLDTLRADRVSAYGHTRETTPAIDKLADDGVLFETVVSYSSWTLPSVVGMLAGRYPTAEVSDGTLRVSLVENLREAGFATAAFTEGGHVSRFYGINRGFDTYEEEEGAVRLRLEGRLYHEGAHGGIEHTFSSAEAWLRKNAHRPFFLLVHTYEVHTPYRRREYVKGLDRGRLGVTFEMADVNRIRRGELNLTESEIEYVSALYDGGVHVADQYIERLITTLDEIGLGARTLIVVTSDHGEELGEHYHNRIGDHGDTLYDNVTKIPLVINDPSGSYAVKRVRAQVRSIDILPTVLNLLGVPLPQEKVDGASLVSLMHGTENKDRIAFSRLDAHTRTDPPSEALRTGTHKLITNAPFALPQRSRVELFDLAQDPGEMNNLAKLETELRAELQSELDSIREPLNQQGIGNFQPKEKVPKSVMERLKSLGYVE